MEPEENGNHFSDPSPVPECHRMELSVIGWRFDVTQVVKDLL
jgi:hypothetical protein